MRWYGIALIVLVVLALLQTLRLGVRLTSGGGKTCLALQMGGLSVFRLRLGEHRPPKLKNRRQREKEAAAAQRKRQKTEKKEKKEKKPGGLSELLTAADDLSFLLDSLKKGLSVTEQRLLRRIVVGRLTVHIAVVANDPMKTTLGYGALSASLYTAVATLSHLVTIRARDIVLVPDYGSTSPTVELDVKLWLRLWHLTHAAAGYVALWRKMKAILKQRGLQKAEHFEARGVS